MKIEQYIISQERVIAKIIRKCDYEAGYYNVHVVQDSPWPLETWQNTHFSNIFDTKTEAEKMLFTRKLNGKVDDHA